MYLCIEMVVILRKELTNVSRGNDFFGQFFQSFSISRMGETDPIVNLQKPIILQQNCFLPPTGNIFQYTPQPPTLDL